MLCKPRVRTGRVRSEEKKDKRAKAAAGVSVLLPARAAQGVQSGTTVWTYQRGTQNLARPGFSPELLLFPSFFLAKRHIAAKRNMKFLVDHFP